MLQDRPLTCDHAFSSGKCLGNIVYYIIAGKPQLCSLQELILHCCRLPLCNGVYYALLQLNNGKNESNGS